MNRIAVRGPRLRAGRRLRPAAWRRTTRRGHAADVTTHVGLIFSSDSFYRPRPELMQPMVEHGVLAVEMEASALYTLAAQHGAPRAGDLHRLRPHRHRRGDDQPGARADLRRDGRDRARRRDARLTSAADDPLQPGPVGQLGPVGLDGHAAAHVVERRAHPLRRHPGQLGPGHPVDRELQRVGGLRAGWSSSRRPGSRRRRRPARRRPRRSGRAPPGRRSTSANGGSTACGVRSANGPVLERA